MSLCCVEQPIDLPLAAKYGNTEVARCLCLAGARIDAKNREGVVAEVCARVQGHASLGKAEIFRIKSSVHTRLGTLIHIVFFVVGSLDDVTFTANKD